MQMAQSNLVAPQPHHKSPFLSTLEGVTQALSPFFPPAAIANATLKTIDGSGGGTPFTKLLNLGGNKVPDAQPGINSTSAKPNASSDQAGLPAAPHMEVAKDLSQDGGSGSPVGTPGDDKPQVTPEMIQQMHHLHSQYPEEMQAVMANPQLLQGGQNFLSAMQQYGQMLGQQSNMMGGM